MNDYTNHQFSLFPYQRPSGKVPISKERIAEAKAKYMSGDKKSAVELMREVNDKLENYNRRLFNSKKKE